MKVVKWALVNAAVCAGLYFAVIEGHEGVKRVIVAWCWFYAVICLVCSSVDKARLEVQEKGRLEVQEKVGSFPAVLSHSVGVGCLLFLVWHGWWFTALAFLISDEQTKQMTA